MSFPFFFRKVIMKIEIHFEIEDDNNTYKYYGKEIDYFVENMNTISEVFSKSFIVYED